MKKNKNGNKVQHGKCMIVSMPLGAKLRHTYQNAQWVYLEYDIV